MTRRVQGWGGVAGFESSHMKTSVCTPEMKSFGVAARNTREFMLDDCIKQVVKTLLLS